VSRVPSPPTIPDRVPLHGLPIDPLTEDEAMDRLFSRLAGGQGGVVLTPNLDHLQRYAKDPHVRAAYLDADLVLADGMPLVWASRLQGTPLPERVPGSDLIWSISRRAASESTSVFLLGGAPGAAGAAAARLVDVCPGLQVAGVHFPDFGFLERREEVRTMVDVVCRAAPDIIFVGLPSPTAEAAIRVLQPRLPQAWFLGVGVSLSFVAGDVRRAPRWTRRAGLEWLWRLLQEPRRLAHRYLVVGIPFAFRLGASALRYRFTVAPER
jgi:N-acetylglucosaminyldiphosphoundecaprenol N-acetyl-beta-D-mannosaminyltransferase